MARVLDRLRCALATAGVIVYRHASKPRAERMRSINAVKSERELLLTHVEAEQLINAVEATARVPGDLGEFASAPAEVQQYLGHDGIVYHVGRFPQSADEEMRGTRFAFVHLDVDLYESTLECLRFFYPRLSPGGILISHDFGADRAPGVQQAFQEYFGPIGVPFIQLSGYQGMVVKLAGAP